MEQRKGKHNHLARSCSFDSFFQYRLTDNQECHGPNVKWHSSIDSLCSSEQHAAVKKTLPFPSMDTNGKTSKSADAGNQSRTSNAGRTQQAIQHLWEKVRRHNVSGLNPSSDLECEVKAKDFMENLTDMSICSEEDVLNCTFESCDTEGKGEVYVSRIIAYLEEVTGESCEKGQLRMLQKMLNPEEKDVTVNLGTFHNVMKQWIAECREVGLSSAKNEESISKDNLCILHTDKKSDASSGQLEGYGGEVNRGNLEATELINDIECLEYRNRKLMDQNVKLQRSVEGFEEANVRLTEEIYELKNKLKSSQQVTLHVKLLENELEDLKTIMKNLEDRNCKLQIQKRQLEKDHQNLSASIIQLQEENGKLTVQKENAHWRNEELLLELVDLKNQLHEAKGVISVKDALLSEKINQSEEMKLTVDEYNDIIKGLKEEINKLRSHLISEELSVPYGTQGIELQSSIAPVRTPEYSLQLEIEEIQQKSDVASDNLPTPLCGTLPLHDAARLIKDMYQKCSQRNLVDFQGITEELLVRQDIAEETKELLQKISCLFYTKITWDMYKGNLAPQLTAVMQRHQTTETDSYTRTGVKKDNNHPAAECVKAEPHLHHNRAEMKVVSGAARMVECETSPEHYNLHVYQSSQKEHNTRCATSSETMQVQRACRGLCDNIDQQQRKLELRFEELFSSEQNREGNISIKWRCRQNLQTEFAAPATDVKHEDQLDSSIWFCSQTKNLCLVSFLLFFTLMLIAYYSFFSFFPGCCQRYSSAECTSSSFWSLLKALLCPQIRLRHGAPPPV